MPKYLVQMKETRVLSFTIEAASEEEAIAAAHESDTPEADMFDERVLHGCTEEAAS